MHTVTRISSDEGRALLPQLMELLRDSVEHGASVGFLLPFSAEANESYWRETFDQIETGNRLLLVVREGNDVAGSVQLDLATKQNGLHRAEVQKLLVHTRYRERGIASELMSALENVARELRRTLLVLDTLEGGTAERLYEKWGYTRVGSIPNYAQTSDTSFEPTVVFYKLLGQSAAR